MATTTGIAATTPTTTGIAATIPDRQAEAHVDAASRYIHAAAGQLHTARESGVDSWQTTAAETLDTALEEYLSAQDALRRRHGWKVEHSTRTYIVWARCGPRSTTASPWAAHPCDHPDGINGWRAGTAKPTPAQTPGALPPSTPCWPRCPPASWPRSARAVTR